MDALSNDVVAVVSNGCHGADTAHSESGASGGVDLTGQRTEGPNTSVEGIPYEDGELGQHHAQVGEGQIDDQTVGWVSQSLAFDEQVDDQQVT